VYDAKGFVSIPRGPSHSLQGLTEFILSRIGFGGSRSIDPALFDYLRQQHDTFGPHRVFCYRFRDIRLPRVGMDAVIFGVALIIAAWISFGIARTRQVESDTFALAA